MKKRSFSEPGCIGCEAHLDFGLSRYCAGFKNKKRRKAFRRSDPAFKAPKWCPKRKEPCEYRIYSYADERSAVMARMFEEDNIGDRDIAFPSAFRYRLRAEGKTGLSRKPSMSRRMMRSQQRRSWAKGFVRRRGGDRHRAGAVLLYCVSVHDFRPAFFDVKHIQTGGTDETEAS